MKRFTVHVHQHKEHISDYIRKYGCWEPITTEVLIEILRGNPGVTFVDVGANIGWFSLVAASEGIHTVAFEPVITNCEVFRGAVAASGFEKIVTLHDIAVGDTSGHLIVNVATHNMGLCSTRDLSEDYDYNELVEVKRLDEVLADEKGPFVVKIDVEHMELPVLRGMERVLNRVNYIIMEISFHQKEIFDILRKNNFTTVVNIGFDHEKKRDVRTDNNYLKGGHWFQTLDGAEEFIQKAGENPQCMFMFTRSIKGPAGHFTI